MTDYLHALPSGYRIEEYELVRVLGSGGFGITYLGYDHHLDKAVAIKEYLPNDLAVRTDNQSVLPKSTQDRADYEWGLERFLSEAQTLARFDHRHIIKIHRFFRAHGTGYIVMEYAEGVTLSELLQRKGTLTEAELKAILFPILDGLEAVHEADFLHRDIKPGNIVIRDDGSPVLIDFGSARQAVAGKSRSVTAIVTPGYAPIEQYSVKGHQGPWTDIYGLGAVCYRCLVGEPPDDATERLREDPLIPAIQRCEGKASAALLNAIDRALRVNEGERPQNIAAWREVLADGGKSGKHATRPVYKPVIQSVKEPAEARTGMSWSSLALVVVIVVLLGASAWQGWQLYRGMPGNGAGETAAVAEHQVDTQTGSQTDMALDAQAGNEVEVAPNVMAFDVFYEDEEETPQPDEESPAVAEPEVKPKQERFSAIHQPTIDRLWELSEFDNQDDKKRLEQTILDMSSDKQDAWYAGAHALIKQHDPSSYPQIVDDYQRYRQLQQGLSVLPIRFLRTYYDAEPQFQQKFGKYQIFEEAVRTNIPYDELKEWVDRGAEIISFEQKRPLEEVRQSTGLDAWEQQVPSIRMLAAREEAELPAKAPDSVQWSQLTLDIQTILTTLGYNLGIVDGIYGEKTGAAIEAFQQDVGIPVDGQISQQLLQTLQQLLRISQIFDELPDIDTNDNTQSTTSVDNSSDEEARTTDTTPTTQNSPSNLTASQEDYFTRGSHADDVLRLQGTPSSINRLSRHETWWFGLSNVKIDSRTRRVLEWSNNGNLNVRLLPGEQVTSETYFTRGSYADDVLRLQGTPSSINRLSRHETWWFGLSNVKIDSRTRRVLEWSNNGNLNVRLLPGEQVTSETYFTRGSHADDVLRLQGTPSSINRLSRHETWWFGLSNVKIDLQTKRVLEWSNNGNLKVKL